MIFKCTHCSGRLKYDIKSRKLRCESCSQLVEFPEIVDTEYIFDEYRCTLCGARLYVNEDDMTSECPYCGAQSVVLEKKNISESKEYFPVRRYVNIYRKRKGKIDGSISFYIGFSSSTYDRVWCSSENNE